MPVKAVDDPSRRVLVGRAGHARASALACRTCYCRSCSRVSQNLSSVQVMLVCRLELVERASCRSYSRVGWSLSGALTPGHARMLSGVVFY